jgi:DNA helicase-2/ATP-dependent DNA helicase PcrA
MLGMTSAPLFQPKSLAPSPQQIELQTSREKSIIVSANAGAAKTTSLALKVAEVLELQRQKTGRYFPKRILTLTYTDVARIAFKRALEKIGVAPDVIGELWISTFDDFSIYLMKELEGGQARVVKAPEELKDIITQCIHEVRDRAIHRPDRNLWLPSYEDKNFHEYFLNATLRLKGKMVLPKAGWSDEPINAVLAENTDEDYSILRIFQCFEALRRDTDESLPLFRSPGDATYDLASTIGDLSVGMPQGMFSKWPGGLHLICVDEFHDMNEAIFTILRRLLESSPQALFCGVGDPDQVLHQKAGAESKFMDVAYFSRETGRKTTSLYLPGSYRFSSSLAQLVGNLAAKQYDSFATTNTQVHSFYYAGWLECAQKIVEDALSWKAQKRSMSQFVILLRHPHQSVLIENMLLERSIPYRTDPFPTYMHRPEVLVVRALLAVSNKAFDLVQSASARHRMIKAIVEFSGVLLDFGDNDHKNDTQEQRLIYAINEIIHDQTLLATFVKKQIVEKADPHIRRRLEAAMKVAAEQEGEEMFVKMLNALDMPGLAAHRWVERKRCTDAVAHLEGLKQAAALFGNAVKFFGHINNLELSYEQLSKAKGQKNFLILTDIPSVKGLEFERVVIPFIERGEFPADDGGTLNDERNLMYVAMTRCSHELTLMFSQNRSSAFEDAMLCESRATT